MSLWKSISNVLSRQCSAAASSCGMPIEQLESRSRNRARIHIPAIIEAMESRIMFSTFDCYMSAKATGTHTASYQVTAWVTGGRASSYVFHWNDPNTGGTTSSTYTAPTGGGPITKTYQYKGSFTGTITVTATSTTSAVSTAYFAHDDTYGNFQGVQGTGATAYEPYGNVKGVGQTSEVLDNLGNSGDALNGDLFVAHTYYPTSTSTPLIAITAFQPGGQFDSSFGVYNGVANNGTFVVPSFGGGSDVPMAITVATEPSTNETYLIVVGKCATGWAVCEVDTSPVAGLTGQYGNFGHDASNFEAGQATAVEAEQSDGGSHMVVVGTDGTHIVAAALNTLDLSAYTSWGTTGIITVPLSGSYAVKAGANAVIEADDTSLIDPGEEVIVGGYTNWCCATHSGSDFTLVSIEDGDGTVDSTIRTNIGTTLCTVTGVCSPSVDSVYALVPFETSGGSFVLDAVGQSTAFNDITIAQYTLNGTTGVVGSLVSSFGQYSAGIATGPAGNAYSAVLIDSSGDIAVTGNAGGDIITAAFTAAGAAYTGFGNSGVMYQDLGTNVVGGTNSTDIGYAAILDTDGSILICGATTPSGSSFSQIALVEYLPSNQVTIS
jgi:hypothetical protein